MPEITAAKTALKIAHKSRQICAKFATAAKLDSTAKTRLSRRLAEANLNGQSTTEPNNQSPSGRRNSDRLELASPTLIVRKRGRPVDPEEDDEQQPKKSKMEEKLDVLLREMQSIKQTVATKEDMNQIKSRLDKVENQQSSMSVSITDTQRRLDRLERGKPPPGEKSAQRSADAPRLVEAYIDARRSLIISPAVANLANIKDFMLAYLKMPVEVVKDLNISGIKQIHPRNIPTHRLGVEQMRKARFSLADAYERDLVISYATNLQEGKRIDIVIPDHLLHVKSQFDNLSYKLRKHTQMTGKKVTTSLRLDDRTQGLIMAVKDSKEDPWSHYSLKELKELESSLTRTPQSPTNEDLGE